MCKFSWTKISENPSVYAVFVFGGTNDNWCNAPIGSLKYSDWENSKNYTLEMLKLFAYYMVVFVHVNLYGELGYATNALARFAVPFFFVVSGFYSYQIPPKRILKRAYPVILILFFLHSVLILIILYSRNRKEICRVIRRGTTKKISPFYKAIKWLIWLFYPKMTVEV